MRREDVQPPVDPIASALRQVEDACASLDGDATGIVDWPWAPLRDLTGPMAPGDVWYVAARSGNGKTTFLTSAVEAWQAAGHRVYVLALETRPRSWRTMWACQRLGIHPGDALSGRLKQLAAAGDAAAMTARQAIQRELVRQVQDGTAARVIVDESEFVDTKTFERSLARAGDLGCDIVLVDHVDHIEPNDSRSAVTESQAVNRRAAKLAQRHNVALVLSSQLNQTINAGHKLARFQPPETEHLWHPSVKQQVATGILGLFRPVDPAASKEDLMAARAGEIEPSLVLKRGTMGVVFVKSRNYGHREGDRTELWVQYGKVVEPFKPAGPAPVRSIHPTPHRDREAAT